MRLRKPWPAEIDQWTHYLHGADGNPVARDRVVGPPEHYQWIAEPDVAALPRDRLQRQHAGHRRRAGCSPSWTKRRSVWPATIRCPTSGLWWRGTPSTACCCGRCRSAAGAGGSGRTPGSTPGPGDIPLNIQKRLVAAGDKVYVTLGYQAPVSQLDARTGEILQTYAGTERTSEILCHGRHAGPLGRSPTSGCRSWPSTPHPGSSSGRRRRPTAGTTIDYIKWTGDAGGANRPKLDPSLNMATDGRVVALIDGPEIVGLDLPPAREKWRAAFPLDEADRNAGGIQPQGNLWIGTMIVRDGVVLHASPHRLAAFSADTGKLLWSQPKKYIGHLWYEWKDVFVIDGLVWTWSAELEQDVFERRSPRETAHAVPAIGQRLRPADRGAEEGSAAGIDLQGQSPSPLLPQQGDGAVHPRQPPRDRIRRSGGGQHTVDNWVRGTCHVGMMPANGLQYVPPHPCQCYIDEKLNGLYALAPAPAERSRSRPGRRRAGAGTRPGLDRSSGPESG